MFCKFCGGTMEPSQPACPRCGRPVPPLSDCGGFFGLTGGPAAQPAPQPVAAQPVVPQPVQPPVAHKKKKRTDWPLVIVLVLMLVVLINLVIQMIQIDSLRGKLEDLQARLDKHLASESPEDKDDPTEEPDPTGDPEGTEPEETDPPQLSLSQQQLQLPLMLEQKTGDQTEIYELKLEECLFTSKPNMSSFREDPSLIVCADGSKTVLEVWVELEADEVEFHFIPDQDVLGERDAAAEMKGRWEYSLDGGETWLAVNDIELEPGQDPLSEDDIDVGNDVHTDLDVKALRAALGHSGQLQLQVTLVRKNKEGGSLTIILKGISYGPRDSKGPDLPGQEA